MANRRTPLEVARTTGAIRVHPARFAGRFDPDLSPIGKAPKWMDANERAAWSLFVSELPWLRKSDSGTLEVASILRGKLIAGTDSIPVLTLLKQVLSALGASPTDRSRIAQPAKPEEDPVAARYFLA